MLSQGCHSNLLSANKEELNRIKKKNPTPQKLACERCVYIELLDKVVQSYMQSSVVRLPLLPGMPPTSVWVMPASAVSSSPPPCAEPAVAGCCCATSWSSSRFPGAQALLLATPLQGVAPAPPQVPQVSRACPCQRPWWTKMMEQAWR